MSGIAHLFGSLLSQYGVPALFVTIALESLGAPLPGESAIVLASGAAAGGEISIRAVVVAAFLGAVLGDNVGYLIGRKLGRPAIVRHGHRFGITEARFDKVEAVARRRGALMVVVARFVVLLRQLNGIVAGSTGMPWPRFLIANVLGAALWVGVWSTLAYRFGHSLEVVPFLVHHLSLVAAIVTPLLIAGLVYLKLRPARRSTS